MSTNKEFDDLTSDYQIASGISGGMYPRANAAIAFRQMKALEAIAEAVAKWAAPPLALPPDPVESTEGDKMAADRLAGRRLRPRFDEKAGD